MMNRHFINHVITLAAVTGLAAMGLLLVFFLLGRSAAGATLDETGTIPKVRLQNATFTVSGTVTCEATGPMSDVEVYAWNREEGSGLVGDVTDISGTYSVTLKAGNYDLIFNPPCGSGCASQSHKGIIGPPDQTRNVVLSPGHTASGTVTDGTTPISNVAIYAFNHDTAEGFGLPLTDANGYYCIGLAEGHYDLGFTPPPCQGLGPKTVTVPITQDISLDASLPPGFTVAGCVTDGSGNPVSGVQIYAKDPHIGGFGFAPTNEFGCYTGTLPYAGIPPTGVYDIQFIPLPGLGLGSVTVTDVTSTTAGCPNTTLPITLPAGFTLSGKVTCRGTGIRNVYVYAEPEGPHDPDNSLPGYGLFTVDDGSYGLPLVSGTYYVELVPPPAVGLAAKAFTTTELITDAVLNVDFCVCSGVWLSETVDIEGAGEYSSLAVASTWPYTPHLTCHTGYSGRSKWSQNWKFARLSGTTWISETVDSGAMPDLALVSTKPHTPCIVYSSNYSWDIKFAYRLDATTWISMRIVNHYAGQKLPSLALQPAYPYNPHIYYFMPFGAYYPTHAYLSGTTWMSGTWVHERLERFGVGERDSVALEQTAPYTPHLSYWLDGNLKHAWKRDSSWLSETVDSTVAVNGLSLALDSNGNPRIGYHDKTNHDLRYAWKSGTTWLSETVDSEGWVGEWPSLELDSRGNPHISYYDRTNQDLKYARFDGRVWIIQAVDSAGDMGWACSLALDPIGCPHISYSDRTNQDLKYAHIPPLADVAIIKLSWPPTLTAGDWLTYTLVYSNNGPDEAVNVVITDAIHPWLTNARIQTRTSYTGCEPITSDRYVWTTGAVPDGGWGIITVTAQVSPSVSGLFSITNRATITTVHVSYWDTNLDNNTSVVHNIVDAEPPLTPTLISPADGTITNTNSITFTWSDESGSGAVSYTLWINGIPHTATVPYSATVLSDGNYTWTVRALDVLGNASGYTDTWNLTVDTTPPEIKATAPVSDVEITAQVIVIFSEAVVTDTFGHTVTPDPGGWSETWSNGETVVTLDHNPFAYLRTHTFTVTAADDLAGNPLSDVYTWHFTTVPYCVYLPLVMRNYP